MGRRRREVCSACPRGASQKPGWFLSPAIPKLPSSIEPRAGSWAEENRMKMAMTAAAAALGAVALLAVSGPSPAPAYDMDDYRWDHDRFDCRVIEIRTTNRWGEDVTVRRRVCN